MEADAADFGRGGFSIMIGKKKREICIMPGGQEKLSVCRPNGHAAFWKKVLTKWERCGILTKLSARTGAEKPEKQMKTSKTFEKP